MMAHGILVYVIGGSGLDGSVTRQLVKMAKGLKKMNS